MLSVGRIALYRLGPTGPGFQINPAKTRFPTSGVEGDQIQRSPIRLRLAFPFFRARRGLRFSRKTFSLDIDFQFPSRSSYGNFSPFYGLFLPVGPYSHSGSLRSHGSLSWTVHQPNIFSFVTRLSLHRGEIVWGTSPSFNGGAIFNCLEPIYVLDHGAGITGALISLYCQSLIVQTGTIEVSFFVPLSV